MAQAVLNGNAVGTEAPAEAPSSRISLGNFKFSSIDDKIDRKNLHHPEAQVQDLDTLTSPSVPPLGPLAAFTGTFAGTGFNTIFRPSNGSTVFTNKVSGPTPPQAPNENILELNLTQETLSFSPPLGKVPNRGLNSQQDINLNGVPYLQTINDVTNINSGKGDAQPNGIHAEPGLWMAVPGTNTDPNEGATLVRMASIPHGTTINAQGPGVAGVLNGPPDFTIAANQVDITPFTIGHPGSPLKGTFGAQTATNANSPRIPQDLSLFIEAGTITQAILDNPTTVLANAIKGQKITKTLVFEVNTIPTAPVGGGGTANISFLTGAQGGPNAVTADMRSRFFIETVEHQINVPAATSQVRNAVHVRPERHRPDAHVPTFQVQPAAQATTQTVTSTQIQYFQVVNLNFGGLTWPHASVATLVPTAVQSA